MKILIVDPVHEVLTNGLRDLGHEVTEHPNMTIEQLPQALKDTEAIVVRSKFNITKEFIEMGPHLKLIARAGAGMDNVDEAYAQQKGIRCIHAAGANADAVAEHAIGMLLMFFNKLKQADMQVRNHIWDREMNRGIELKGKNIGIIGMGHTGSALAKKLSSFDVNIYGYDKYKKNFGNSYTKEATLAEVFNHADIISFHIPLNSETKYMLNNEWLQSFKKNIYVLNLSRGGVVNTADLTQALLSGKVLGCMLDVLENEKLNTYTSEQKEWFEVLTNHPKTLFSPHVAGWTDESYERISAFLLQSFNRLEKDFI